MTTVLDTNIVIRHLTQQPTGAGKAASHFLASTEALLLTDVIATEIVQVLGSVHQTPRETIARALRALLAMRSITAKHGPIIQRALDLYEFQRMDFTAAYLVAFAEANGHHQIASFDKGIDKAINRVIGKTGAVARIDPANSAAR